MYAPGLEVYNLFLSFDTKQVKSLKYSADNYIPLILTIILAIPIVEKNQLNIQRAITNDWK